MLNTVEDFEAPYSDPIGFAEATVDPPSAETNAAADSDSPPANTGKRSIPITAPSPTTGLYRSRSGTAAMATDSGGDRLLMFRSDSMPDSSQRTLQSISSFSESEAAQAKEQHPLLQT
jgi:hypothetical protein